MSKNVAIVVGHTRLRPGAKGHEVEAEFHYNSKVAEMLKDVADVFHYDSYNLGYTSMVKRNAAKINKKDYKLVLELHYNAASPQAHGCEVLYYFRNQDGKRLSKFLSAMISRRFKVRDRGAKALVSKKDRGFAAVYYTNPTTLIVEPFFGSNESDAGKFRDYEDYARTLEMFIELYNMDDQISL
jgi:N-acetylmuramoyl-L-alanine amidase